MFPRSHSESILFFQPRALSLPPPLYLGRNTRFFSSHCQPSAGFFTPGDFP